MKHIKTTICLVVFLIANLALADVHYVPYDYTTIQAAINASQDFDTVIVAPGSYSGSGNRNINFNGKAITVRSTEPSDPQIVSATVIDCNGMGRGFAFNTWEKADSTLTGLTIINGYSVFGGAIYCSNNSSPSIINCVFSTNSAALGGAIACGNTNSSPKITNCKVIANSALVGGGGIYCNSASPIIRNCIISGNFAPNGGAMYSHNVGNPVVANSTIVGNAASDSAGGVFCYKSSDLTINNCILWADTAMSASEVRVGNLGAATTIQISYSDIQGGDENVLCDSGCTVNWGQGNINIDPNFVEIGYLNENKIYFEGDYHLRKGSPCIDAGDPAFVAEPNEADIDGNQRILGEKIDIGADEYIPPIPAIVQLKPETLNLTGNNRRINCSIKITGNYNIGDIDTATIVLNGNIEPEWSTLTIDEEAQKLLVKFSIFGAQSILNAAEGPLLLTVTGKLNDGRDFEGTDTVRIMRTRGKSGKK